MNNEKHNKHISKFLSLILRHKPETIGITLDQNGWTLGVLGEKSNQARGQANNGLLWSFFVEVLGI